MTDPLVKVKSATRTNQPNSAGWGEWKCEPECGHEPVLRVGEVPPKRVRCRQCGERKR